MPVAFQAATATGLPVWAGFSARRGKDGRLLGFSPDQDIAFEETLRVLDDYGVAAAGIMHTPANLIDEGISILGRAFDGPLTVYPDSGYFKMPNWQFEDVIAPDDLRGFAAGWVENGVRVLGGCCGLTPAHIAALAPLSGSGRR